MFKHKCIAMQSHADSVIKHARDCKTCCIATMGSFTYYVISRGGGGFQMLTVDYRGGLAVDYVIKY